MTEVYHVVTGRPLRAGQVILMGGAHTNGVYERGAGWQALERGEDVAGPLGALLRGDRERWACVARRELALERVRAAEFDAYPSRMACLYASRTEAEARSWARYFMELGREVYSLARLSVAGRVFTGDACNCFDGTPDKALNDELARRYWRALPTDEPVFETLIDGEITVCELVEEYR